MATTSDFMEYACEGDTYYPGGVTDPEYCVLKFTAQKRAVLFRLQIGGF
jgi:general stress protein 26